MPRLIWWLSTDPHYDVIQIWIIKTLYQHLGANSKSTFLCFIFVVQCSCVLFFFHIFCAKNMKKAYFDLSLKCYAFKLVEIYNKGVRPDSLVMDDKSIPWYSIHICLIQGEIHENFERSTMRFDCIVQNQVQYYSWLLKESFWWNLKLFQVQGGSQVNPGLWG